MQSYPCSLLQQVKMDKSNDTTWRAPHRWWTEHIILYLFLEKSYQIGIKKYIQKIRKIPNIDRKEETVYFLDLKVQRLKDFRWLNLIAKERIVVEAGVILLEAQRNSAEEPPTGWEKHSSSLILA